MSDVYQSLAHSKWDCKYLVVFVPKRRRKAIFGQIRRQLARFCIRWRNRGVRHPPQSGWLDEWGRLKGGRAMGLGVARCAPQFTLQNCPLPSAASCSRMLLANLL